MKERALQLVREIHARHGELAQAFAELEAMADAEVVMTELADMAYAMREANDLLEDSAKHARKVKATASKRACMVWVAVSSSGDKIRTDWCTASPDMLICVTPPKDDTPEYTLMMEDLGVPIELYRPAMDGEELKSPPLKFDYKGLAQFLTKRQGAGHPLPRGVNPVKVFNEFELNIRKKKSIIEAAPKNAEGEF
jgi:hypothetical protein